MNHYGFFGIKQRVRANQRKRTVNHITILHECVRENHTACIPHEKNRLGGINHCLCVCHSSQRKGV
jgi:hypothetical protein